MKVKMLHIRDRWHVMDDTGQSMDFGEDRALAEKVADAINDHPRVKVIRARKEPHDAHN